MFQEAKKNRILLATSIGQIAVVKQLILEGYNVNEFSDEGNCALLEAASRNDTNIVELLLKHGANPNAQDLFGHTALYWAKKNNNPQMERIIEESITQTDAFKKRNKP